MHNGRQHQRKERKRAVKELRISKSIFNSSEEKICGWLIAVTFALSYSPRASLFYIRDFFFPRLLRIFFLARFYRFLEEKIYSTEVSV